MALLGLGLRPSLQLHEAIDLPLPELSHTTM